MGRTGSASGLRSVGSTERATETHSISEVVFHFLIPPTDDRPAVGRPSRVPRRLPICTAFDQIQMSPEVRASGAALR